MIAQNVFVRVPVASGEPVVAAGPDLYEADTSFQQPAGDQALAAEVGDFFGDVDLGREAGARGIETIELEDVLGFAADVESFGGGELELCCEFVAADACFES